MKDVPCLIWIALFCLLIATCEYVETAKKELKHEADACGEVVKP